MSGAAFVQRRRIASASDLQSVVRAMRALAASGIQGYEQSVRALADYLLTVELGLGACLREQAPVREASAPRATQKAPVVAIVFGSDQGLVGPFNDVVVEHAVQTLAPLSSRPEVWSVGERVRERLAEAGLPSTFSHAVPQGVDGIAPLVGRLQLDAGAPHAGRPVPRLLVFHNRPLPGALYEPVDRLLLPLDADWYRQRAAMRWPTRCPPEVLGSGAATLRALVREYLYISLFQACAESLASENASRLAAMERADKNIDELLEALHGDFNRLRQRGIDEELFDLSAGFEALSKP